MENIKKSWKDITITDYKQIMKILEREYDSPLEKDMAVCALLNGISEEDMYAMDFAQGRKMLSEMEWMKKDFAFNRHWNLKHLNINGKRCRMYQNIESLSMAQYLDFENFWEKRDECMGNVLACFIVPEGHKYNEGYDVVQFAQELEDTLSIEEWNSIAFFLLRSWSTSIRCSLRYGEWQMLKMRWKTKDETQKKEISKAIRQMRQARRYMP